MESSIEENNRECGKRRKLIDIHIENGMDFQKEIINNELIGYVKLITMFILSEMIH